MVHGVIDTLTTQPADWANWLHGLLVGHRRELLWIVIGLVGLLVIRSVWRSIARRIRRLRPAQIHPRLAKYNIDHAELDRHRREQAKLVVATSTSARLAGFRLVRQVEAVFVEGFRTPEDAMIALKATAAERGANALLNVKTERTSGGRCTASGDAVAVVPLKPIKRPGRTSPPSKPPSQQTPRRPTPPPPPTNPPPNNNQSDPPLSLD